MTTKQVPGAQEALQALFAAMTDVVLVLDRDGRYLKIPQTNAAEWWRPDPDLVGKRMHDHMPAEKADFFLAAIREALATGRTVTRDWPLKWEQGTAWISAQVSPMSADSVVVVARDVTELMLARQELERQRDTLEQEVRERQQAQEELRALFMAMQDVVLVFDAQGRCLRVATTNPDLKHAPTQDKVGCCLEDLVGPEEAEVFRSAIQRALAERRPQAFEHAIHVEDGTRWISVVISPMSEDKVVIVGRDVTDRIGAQQELERAVAERTRELVTLLDVSRNVASMLELQPLLQTIVEQLHTIVDYCRASVFLLEGDELVLINSRVRSGEPIGVSLRIDVNDVGSFWEVISSGRGEIIDDVRDASEDAQLYRQATGDLFDTALKDVHSFAAVPLALHDRVIGILTVSHTEVGFYNERHTHLLEAVASQAAIAIENARLYEQAQHLAAVEERQRLARELHDSVSQALYGIALGARTARTLLDQDPSRAQQPLDYVLSLAEAGLAEMRALIFELRPESLAIEGLVAALEKQVAAIAARYGIRLETQLMEEPDLPLPHKEAFYRIGQEALHNVVKHARAARAGVRLFRDDGALTLEISDDGVGFEADRAFPGHMGMVSMRERAASIGARLDFESAAGRGTLVRLVAPMAVQSTESTAQN